MKTLEHHCFEDKQRAQRDSTGTEGVCLGSRGSQVQILWYPTYAVHEFYSSAVTGYLVRQGISVHVTTRCMSNPHYHNSSSNNKNKKVWWVEGGRGRIKIKRSQEVSNRVTKVKSESMYVSETERG